MTEAIKKIMSVVANVSSGSRVVSSYDKSTYPVRISANGSVGVEAKTLVNSSEAKRHIEAVRELHKEVKETK